MALIGNEIEYAKKILTGAVKEKNLFKALVMLTKYYYFEIATFLYVASGYYLVTMNGIRQCLAASILFAATPFLIKRKKT